MKKQLKELATLVNGYAFKSNNYCDKGIRVIRIANVQDGYISDERPCFYPIEFEQKLGEAILEENDLLMSLTGNVGRVALLSKDFLPAGLNQRVECIRPFDSGMTEYLFYYFRSKIFTDEVTSATMGCAQQNLSIKWLEKHLIPIYTLEKQNEIVNELQKLDRVISVKKEQLLALDALAKSRFVEMFGYDIKDCDQSEQVKEIANVRVGIVIQPTQYYTSNKEVGIKAFRSVNVRPFMVNDSDWVYFDPESHSRMSKTHIHSNEVLIVRSGANLGQSCVVPEEYEGSNAIDILIVKVDEEKILPGFFCAFVNFPMGRMQILDGQRGGAQKHLNVGVFEKARIPIPSIEKQREFVSFVEATDKSKAVIQKSLDETQLLFDSLMQKYFG